ncbi:hypothetical protein [Streptomyces jumonjinensis]|uniref:Uncharacterized protein n=1 Tax=Streptomyces jumonjinensis TaxID=1945 RepID=A0A646KCJ7_STRJU|nr:hypothetical protein [Streptomyces jumonjinensis]MQS99991.1 hypothetical protein [Streptomyces jumonjinensis]
MTTLHGHTTAIGLWLAESLADPTDALATWRDGSHAMLPAGGRFDAVRIPIELVHAAADSAIHTTVAEHLTTALDGPVVCDPARWYYALVPPGTTESWTCGLARCLGRGAWLGVPHTDLTDHTRLHWCVPMEYPARLCDPGVVAALIERGHGQLTPEHTEFRRPR